jgi:hypothetical protein
MSKKTSKLTFDIDRSKIPSVEQFFGLAGRGWKSIERNEKSLALKEIDFSKAVFVSPPYVPLPHKDGEGDTLWAKREREKEEDDKFIRLDSGIGFALCGEPNQSTLRLLHDTFGITRIEFTGDLVFSRDYYRYLFALSRNEDGSWSADYVWAGQKCKAHNVSIRIAK